MKVCIICEEPFEGYGHNARPYMEGRCCDICNVSWVIPMRMGLMRAGQQKLEIDLSEALSKIERREIREGVLYEYQYQIKGEEEE